MKFKACFLIVTFQTVLGFAFDPKLLIFNEFTNTYEPMAREQGVQFTIEIDPKNSSTSAAAEVSEKKWILSLSGGLLNHPNLHPDVLRIILCHELGHILGGAPRRNLPFDWQGPVAKDGLSSISSEGQADYYATRSCFRLLVQGQDHERELLNIIVSPKVKQDCDLSHSKSTNASYICQRATMAALGFLKLNFSFPISFITPNLTPSSVLVRDQYPDRQCRLDTFFAGSLCADPIKKSFDFSNEDFDECKTSMGKRPFCWYR